jgi:hypothetical protein
MAASVLSLLHFCTLRFFCCVAASRAREQVYAWCSEVGSAANRIQGDAWKNRSVSDAVRSVIEQLTSGAKRAAHDEAALALPMRK